jgi:hypothetical protein
LSFTAIADAQEIKKLLKTIESDLDSIDSMINVSLEPLACLSLASVSLLVSSSGLIQQQRVNEEIRLTSEQNEETCKQLETDLEMIKRKQKCNQWGTKFLARAFFWFTAEMVILLLIFDSFYDQLTTAIQNDLITISFEVLPFLISLIFLIIGVVYIKHAYVR